MKDRTTFKRGDTRVARSFEDVMGQGHMLDKIIKRRSCHGGNRFRSDGKRKGAGKRA